MRLTQQQKLVCEQVINVFETSKPDGDYGAISVYDDGPRCDYGSGRIYQITYGRSQTTESGNLSTLLRTYASSNGKYSAQIKPYIDKLCVVSSEKPNVYVLTLDQKFKNLLKDAGNNDTVMQQVQDQFFDKEYFQPAMEWAKANGFTLPLSALVIYDSFIHSGRIRTDIRNMFPEVPPAKGGDERKWITQYVNAREKWLSSHSNPILHKTVCRTHCFKEQIAKNNWDLSQLPIMANGTPVYGRKKSLASA